MTKKQYRKTFYLAFKKPDTMSYKRIKHTEFNTSGVQLKHYVILSSRDVKWSVFSMIRFNGWF